MCKPRQSPWESVYYETTPSGGRFWEHVGERWLARSERQVARFLSSKGVPSSLSKEDLAAGKLVSELDQSLRLIETQHVVNMSGAFAGWHAGFRLISNQPVLVTDTAKLVEPLVPSATESILEDEELPVGGKCHGWPALGRYFNSRFASDDPATADQMLTWCSVLRRCYLAMVAGSPKRCQAMVFAGDPGCGKSLLFSIMQEVLGGRAYKPLRYLMGRTEFNKGMVESPLLIVDDEGSDTKIAGRKLLTANVKQIVATESLSCHGKGKDEYDIKTQRLLCFAVNMEEDNLMVLPPMDEDVEGKIHLFRFYSGEFPWPSSWQEEQIWELVSQELPHFIHWLLNEFELPDRLHEQRFGVLPYHHLEVLEGLDFLSPEARLMNWIERTVLNPDKNITGVWEGTAGQLEEEFKCSTSPLTESEKDKVPMANPTLGKQLGKLMRKPQHAGRIAHPREAGTGQRLWRLVSQKTLDKQNVEQEEVEL